MRSMLGLLFCMTVFASSAYTYSGSELENHDEQRAATAFSFHRERAAALAMATVPGARLFHQGQFEGRRARFGQCRAAIDRDFGLTRILM